MSNQNFGMVNLAKLSEGNLAIVVSVCTNNCTVDQLLQLIILKIIANHNLQNVEEITVADVSIVVQVIHAECEPQLFFLTPTGG
jgi:hypothetical protein